MSYVKDKNHRQILETTVGKRQSVPDSDYTVTIKDYIPDAELKQEPINKSDEPNNPAIFMKFISSEKVVAEGWLLAYGRNAYEDKKRNLRIEYIWSPSQEELDKSMNSPENSQAKVTAASGIASAFMAKNTVRILQEPEGKQLLVLIKDKTTVETVPCELQKKYTIKDTDLHVLVSRYFPSFDFKKEVIKKSDHIGVSAILVEFEGPRGKVADWLFSNAEYATWYTDNNFALVYEPAKEN